MKLKDISLGNNALKDFLDNKSAQIINEDYFKKIEEKREREKQWNFNNSIAPYLYVKCPCCFINFIPSNNRYWVNQKKELMLPFMRKDLLLLEMEFMGLIKKEYSLKHDHPLILKYLKQVKDKGET